MSIYTALWCRIDFPPSSSVGTKTVGGETIASNWMTFHLLLLLLSYWFSLPLSTLPLLLYSYFSSAPLYTTSAVTLFIPYYQPELKFLIPPPAVLSFCVRQLLCHLLNLTSCLSLITYKFSFFSHSSLSTLCVLLLFSSVFCCSGLRENTYLYVFCKPSPLLFGGHLDVICSSHLHSGKNRQHRKVAVNY